MEIKIDRDIFLKCLTHIQGVVEKKNTLPILSNVLIEAFEDKIQVSATDLDIIITEKNQCRGVATRIYYNHSPSII